MEAFLLGVTVNRQRRIEKVFTQCRCSTGGRTRLRFVMSAKSIAIDREIVLRQPESILQKKFGENLKVVEFESTSLVKAGDNYGSTILQVRVVIKSSDNEDVEEINLVAKMLPPTDYQRAIFESFYSFKKEIFIYEDLIPTYKCVYNKDFDIIPAFYGARISLNFDQDEVDDDAAMLMENLKIKGYYMEDRRKGLDLQHIKFAVKTLAKFHAVGLVTKLKNPSFLLRLKRYSKPIALEYNNIATTYLHNMLDAVNNDPILRKYLNRIKATGNVNSMSATHLMTLDLDDPWACVCHKDFWINNVLFHCDKRGIIDDVKFIDFQTHSINSPMTDLVYFLFTSMRIELMENFEEMLEIYRQVAVEVLEEMACDSNLFSKNQFKNRLKIDATQELFHILMMLKFVELREGEEVQESSLNEYCLVRLRKVIEIYLKNDWI